MMNRNLQNSNQKDDVHRRYNESVNKFTREVRNHIPTLRCHEEVMSKYSSYQSPDECLANTVNRNKSPKCNVKSKKHDRPKPRPVLLKSKNVYESASAPVKAKNKYVHSKASESKSVADFHSQNLEDSVDFIPVKLTMNDEFIKKDTVSKPKRNVKTLQENKDPGTYRATWDQLLKNGVCSSQELKSKLGMKETNSSKNCFVNKPRVQSTECLHNLNRPRSKKKLKEKEAVKKSYTVVKDLDDVGHKSSHSPKSANSLNSPFFDSCPIKTLDFLIKQLREKLTKQPENDNLNRIILEMENALIKICNENNSPRQILGEKAFNNVGSSTLSSAPKYMTSDKEDLPKSKNGQLDVAQLQKGLEESCLFLQSLCIKQKENCNNHLREKEQLTLQLAESRRLLAIAKSKEKDYEVTIGELRLKVHEADSRQDQQLQSTQELKDTITQLKAENEMLNSYKDAVKKISVRLKETAREKEILHSKLYLKELEIEKLKVLLDVKENLKPVSTLKTNEIRTKDLIPPQGRINLPKSLRSSRSGSLVSVSTEASWTQEWNGVLCSSQASSTPRHSPTPSNSWRHISSICQKPLAASDINKGIADIFKNLKTKTSQNEPPKLDLELPSSNSSFWSDKEDDLNSKTAFSNRDSRTLSC